MISDIEFLAAVLILAICLTGIVEGVKEDSEKRRLVRRERYRREAYRKKDVERCREILWESVMK